MVGIVTVQPFKAVYSLLAALFEAARFPLWVLLYIPRFTRPNPRWTFGQALRMRVLKAFLGHFSAVRAGTPLSLAPGREADRFAVLQPAADGFPYKGPLLDPAVSWQSRSLARPGRRSAAAAAARSTTASTSCCTSTAGPMSWATAATPTRASSRARW